MGYLRFEPMGIAGDDNLQSSIIVHHDDIGTVLTLRGCLATIDGFYFAASEPHLIDRLLAVRNTTGIIDIEPEADIRDRARATLTKIHDESQLAQFRGMALNEDDPM